MLVFNVTFKKKRMRQKKHKNEQNSKMTRKPNNILKCR